MAKRTLEGTGILSGTWDDEEIEREREEERQKEAAAAERAAQQEATKHKLEETMVDYLRDEIAEELQDQKKKSSGSDKRSREDFKRFREHCARLDLPALPAAPATVAAFLTSEIHLGRPHLRRLIKSISATHLRCDLHDPTSDLLVRALLRLAIDGPPQTVTTKKGKLKWANKRAKARITTIRTRTPCERWTEKGRARKMFPMA